MCQSLSLLSCGLVLSLLGLCPNGYAQLSPFSSDGCSVFPDGTLEQRDLWLSCCQAHDYAYWKGGSYAQRRAADAELEACVSAVGEPEIAALMLAGVRVGGSPLWPTRYRWGYGWPYPKFYGELSPEEQQQVKTLTAAQPQPAPPLAK